MLHVLSRIMLALCLLSPQIFASDVKKQAQDFIDSYTLRYLEYLRISNEASWGSNTFIMEGAEVIDRINVLANEAFSRYTGSVEVIETSRALLAKANQLDPLQVRILQSILYNAANNPQTVADLVRKRIAAETEQTNKMFGFSFKLDGKELTPNEIDGMLLDSKDLLARQKVWEASKEVGVVLKDGLANLVTLRNGTVQALDYKDYFDYQVSSYDMSTAEMMELNKSFLRDLRPLYRQLHTWARYQLASRYGAKQVPDLIPAHWLPNRWAQTWESLVQVKGLDLNGVLGQKTPEWIVEQSERFYVSLGFPPLPKSFYEKSSLYPVSPKAAYKKNTHASAWHMDYDQDVRSLMSVEANSRWYNTAHHELGHIYYYLSYSRPEVPPLLRGGANRAFHEAIGYLIGMASMQKPFLAGLGLIPADAKTDDTQILLKEALDKVVYMPFASGTMTFFEHDLYATNLSKDQYNARWWEYARKFQGIQPPSPRDERYCDAATKTHINDDAAQYYDYALSYVLLFQIHDYIAKNILKQDPHATNYYGNKQVGEFLRRLLELGATKDWRVVLRESIGQDLSAKPMLEYFQPLMGYLEQENKGRTHTLPEL